MRALMAIVVGAMVLPACSEPPDRTVIVVCSKSVESDAAEIVCNSGDESEISFVEEMEARGCRPDTGACEKAFQLSPSVALCTISYSCQTLDPSNPDDAACYMYLMPDCLGGVN